MSPHVRRFATVPVLLWLALAWPGAAHARPYEHEPRSCGDGASDPGWHFIAPDPFVAAAAGCPEEAVRIWAPAGEPAPRFAAASIRFTGPHGTEVRRIAGAATAMPGPGWKVGIFDFSNRVWLWCGDRPSCPAGSPEPVLVPAAAQTVGLLMFCDAVECSRESVHGIDLSGVTLSLDDPTLPAVAVTGGSITDGWRSGTANVAYDAADNTGIASLEFRLNGASTVVERACDVHQPAPCPNGGGTVAIDTRGAREGRLPLTVVATDAAGNRAETTRDVLVDNTAPEPPRGLSVAGGGDWRATNRFSVAWRNAPQDDVSPIAAAEYELCRAGVAPGDPSCVRGNQSAAGIEELEAIAVPGAGEWTLRVWLRDAAGNQSSDRAVAPVALRLDDQGPVLAVERHGAPRRLSVAVADQGSGVASGAIELRRRGAVVWQALPTQVTAEGLTADLAGASLAGGIYAIRARARDRSGNEATTGTFADGSPAEIALPEEGELPERSRGRLSIGEATRETAYGRPVRVTGRLTSGGGIALAHASIEVLERRRTRGSAFERVAAVTTSSTGQFTVVLPKGPSRRIALRFAGTPTVHPAAAEVDVVVRAKSSIGVDRREARNGERVTFRGRVPGGLLPATGKLVALQARTTTGWRTFALTRANRRTGRWSVRYRFRSTRGLARYRLRARVPAEAGYPFASGTSRSVHVRVRGRRS